MSKVNSNLIFLLLTLNIFETFSGVSIVDFKRVNVNWVYVHLVLLVFNFFCKHFFFQALDGFLMVISQEGKFVYISETILQYLGLSQVLTNFCLISINSLTTDFIYHIETSQWICIANQ